MIEFTIPPKPVLNRQRFNQELNRASSINNTTFIPPSITDDQYIIPDRTIGVAVQSVEVLDAVGNGSIAVLGNGRLVII